MNFWDVHGIIFLLGMTFLPRISMIFAGTLMSFGLLGWLGWIFTPHLTVAILATTYYWDTNPILVIISWFIAFGGTTGEAATAVGAAGKATN